LFPVYLFWQQNAKIKIIEKTCYFFSKKKETANVLQGCFWCDVLWKNLRLFARGRRCQNKVSFDRPQPELNKVKSYVFFCICMSCYFSLFLVLSLYLFLFLLIYFSCEKVYFYDFKC
jgi:hypothetical protein